MILTLSLPNFFLSAGTFHCQSSFYQLVYFCPQRQTSVHTILPRLPTGATLTYRQAWQCYMNSGLSLAGRNESMYFEDGSERVKETFCRLKPVCALPAPSLSLSLSLSLLLPPTPLLTFPRTAFGVPEIQGEVPIRHFFLWPGRTKRNSFKACVAASFCPGLGAHSQFCFVLVFVCSFVFPFPMLFFVRWQG